jgi:hypothetical protein
MLKIKGKLTALRTILCADKIRKYEGCHFEQSDITSAHPLLERDLESKQKADKKNAITANTRNVIAT